MDSTLTCSTSTPATGLSHWVVSEIAFTAPVPAAQGTALPVAVRDRADVAAAAAPFAQAAVAGARHTALPGPVPRGAPV